VRNWLLPMQFCHICILCLATHPRGEITPIFQPFLNSHVQMSFLDLVPAAMLRRLESLFTRGAEWPNVFWYWRQAIWRSYERREAMARFLDT